MLSAYLILLDTRPAHTCDVNSHLGMYINVDGAVTAAVYREILSEHVFPAVEDIQPVVLYTTGMHGAHAA